ncbi:hypothetical protein DFJ74DRAFT_686627 [Hyaloraphidium curvatum]|nr:hypothetical protein DFJ74DRAFT_686627 [Hyaloraphidium curvatum]
MRPSGASASAGSHVPSALQDRHSSLEAAMGGTDGTRCLGASRRPLSSCRRRRAIPPARPDAHRARPELSSRRGVACGGLKPARTTLGGPGTAGDSPHAVPAVRSRERVPPPSRRPAEPRADRRRPPLSDVLAGSDSPRWAARAARWASVRPSLLLSPAAARRPSRAATPPWHAFALDHDASCYRLLRASRKAGTAGGRPRARRLPTTTCGGGAARSARVRCRRSLRTNLVSQPHACTMADGKDRPVREIARIGSFEELPSA